MRNGVSLIVLMISIVIIIILSFAISLGIISNYSVLDMAEEAKVLSNFVAIREEVILYANTMLIKKTNFTEFTELLPIERDENGQAITMQSYGNMLLYSEIKILQGFPEEVDLTKVYKLKSVVSNNVYAIINDENKTFDIILADGVKLKNTIFYSQTIFDAIVKVNRTESLQEYRKIINSVSNNEIITNRSQNGGFEKGTDSWGFYSNTESYSNIQNSYQISGSSSLNIDCDQPQDKEYSVYKDLTGGNNGDILYMAASIYIPENTPNIYTLRKANYESWNSQNNVRFNSDIIGKWQRKSMSRPISSDDVGARLYIGIVENKEVKAPINIYIDDVVVVNLTQLFGANIPTQEQCDILFSKYYNGDMGKQYLYYTVANQQ
jgi:hypothetical protein